MNKETEILKYSNPTKVAERAYLIYGPEHGKIYISTRKNKKYMIYDHMKNKMVHFGQMGYQDYTKHKSEVKRNLYHKRMKGIKGDWDKNPYSPNQLSMLLLW